MRTACMLLAVALVTGCSKQDDTDAGDPGETGPSPYDIVPGPYEAEVRWT